jgi:hypothetical protein
MQRPRKKRKTANSSAGELEDVEATAPTHELPCFAKVENAELFFDLTICIFDKEDSENPVAQVKTLKYMLIANSKYVEVF